MAEHMLGLNRIATLVVALIAVAIPLFFTPYGESALSVLLIHLGYTRCLGSARSTNVFSQ